MRCILQKRHEQFAALSTHQHLIFEASIIDNPFIRNENEVHLAKET